MIKNKPNFRSFDFESIIRKLLLLIPLGVIGNVIFTYLLANQNLSRVLSQFNISYFLGVILLALVPWFTHSLRIFTWLNFMDIKISFRELFKIVLGNELGAALTPTAVGGGYLKIGLLMRNNLSFGQALSVNTLGSIEDALFFLIFLPVAFTLSNTWKYFQLEKILPEFDIILIIKVVFIIINIFLGILNLLSKLKIISISKIRQKVKAKIVLVFEDFKQVFGLVGSKGKLLLTFNVFIVGIQWICRYSVITLLLYSLNIGVDPVMAFALQWVVFTIMNIIPSPGAMGGAEAAFLIIYRSLIPSSAIGIVISGWRFLTFYMLLTIAAILFFVLNIKQEKSHPVPQNISEIAVEVD